MQIVANPELIPINFIVFKVPPVQFWSPWSLEVTQLGIIFHCDIPGLGFASFSLIINYLKMKQSQIFLDIYSDNFK